MKLCSKGHDEVCFDPHREFQLERPCPACQAIGDLEAGVLDLKGELQEANEEIGSLTKAIEDLRGGR